MRKAQRHGAAFTLLELLVVVVIIVLLLSILLPNLSHIKEMTRRLVCASRLRAIAMGCATYMAEHRGELFPCRNAEVQICLNPPEMKLARTVDLDKDYWECPNREGVFLYEGSPNDVSADALRRNGYKVIDNGYDFDQWILGYQYFGGIRQWRTKLGVFESCSPVNMHSDPTWAVAADGILKVDGYWGGGRPAAFNMLPAHPDPDTGMPVGGNVAFFDGSCRWYAFHQMYEIHSWNPTGRECYWFQRDLGEYGKRLGVTP